MDKTSISKAVSKDVKKICEDTLNEYPELFRRLAEYEKMEKEERTIVKEEIVERFMEDIGDRSKIPWYELVWWRFKWKYEAVEYWWRKKRQTWRTGFPHEQAWNFQSWNAEMVVPLEVPPK